jgi:FlaA1/EpsC-like NDP-sugar epimerase
MKRTMQTWFNVRDSRAWLLLGLDILLIALSYAAVIAARLIIREQLTAADEAALSIRTYLATLPLLGVLRLLFFAQFGMYRSGWRYAGLRDCVNIVKATSLSSLLFAICAILTYDYFRATLHTTYWYSVFIGDWVLITLLLIMSRFALRLKKEILAWRRAGLTNAVIVGAGDAGVMLLREIANNPNLTYAIRGFIDDDPRKRNMLIQGVPVIGTRAELPTLIHTLFIEEVLIAIPSASGRAIREIIETCTTLGVRFKTLPSVTDIVDGKITISDLRDVDITDVLRREPVRLDTARIRDALRDRTVLVTGGGGSIGSELCRQIALYRPRELVLVELSEFNLYQIDRELRGRFPGVRVLPYVADIKNETRLRTIFADHNPSLVFHAAAYKHVPIMERNPVEAVLNNVKGTMNVAHAADKAGCAEFVMISTDKAVRPSSIMGATKRVAELYVQAFNPISQTNYISVRFGNVLDSSGSVLPLFKEQIMRGGPVTVTHPEITRYFMLIPEAAQLVLEAATLGDGGEIFILDMGKPVRIIDLARNLIQLMGKQPNSDIDIVFTGLRPGEKLHEQLVYEGSEAPTRVEKIMVARAAPPVLSDLQEKVADLIAVATVNNVPRIYECLRDIVPEFTPDTDWESAERTGAQ